MDQQESSLYIDNILKYESQQIETMQKNTIELSFEDVYEVFLINDKEITPIQWA